MRLPLPQVLTAIFCCVPLALAQLGTTLQDPSVRYVSQYGNDSNDGKTWTTAKASVAGAMGALPLAAPPLSIRFGTIYIGPGRFVENATPIELNANVHMVCAASGDGGFGQGSTIQLGDNRNTSLFSYTDNFAAENGYAHFLEVENCTFDGNATRNSSAPPLVQIYNGGFQNTFRNVAFQNSHDYALRIENHAVSFSCYSCTWGGTSGNGGALYLNDLAGGNVVSLFDTQIDNSGATPIYINQTNGDTGGSNILTIVNLKTEATVGRTNHKNIVHFVPRPGGGGNPFNVIVHGMTCENTIGSGEYAVFEENNPGYGANWEITGVNVGGYKGAFQSAKTGQTSFGLEIKHLIASVPYSTSGAAYQYTPDLELSGGAAILTGRGTPQGNIPANVGAIYLRLDGGPSSTMYVKESGTGPAGWVAK